MTTTFDPNTGQPLPPQPPSTGGPSPVTVNFPQPPPPAPSNEGMFTREQALELIEKTRKEEKDKLYPEIEELKQFKAAAEKEKADREAEAARLQAEAEEIERRRREEEMSAKDLIEQRDREWAERYQSLTGELEKERVLRSKEAEFAALHEYRLRRLGEERETIEPRLVDFITGNTQEEIERSITIAKEKTAQIQADVEETIKGNRRSVPLPVSGGPPTDMAGLGEGNQRTFSVEDLRNMSMDEYSQIRPQLLGATSDRVSKDGLYSP